MIFLDAKSRHDLHIHANFSDDGVSSSEELVEMGQARKLTSIGIVAHAHLVRPAAPTFVQKLRALESKLGMSGWLGVGLEADIININGRVDLDGFDRLELDFVIGSMHYLPSSVDHIHSDTRAMPLAQAYTQITEVVTNTIRNPKVDIIGHPFGYIHRIWGLQLPIDCVEKIAQAAAEEGVALDMGSQRYSLPQEYELAILRTCQSYGATICLGSDAHHADQVGRIDYGFYGDFL